MIIAKIHLSCDNPNCSATFYSMENRRMIGDGVAQREALRAEAASHWNWRTVVSAPGVKDYCSIECERDDNPQPRRKKK
jgi:hypothetical protein